MIKNLYIWKLVNGQANCNYSDLVVSSKGHAAKDLSCASKDPEQFCRQERLTVNDTSNCKISKNPLLLTFCPPRSSILHHIWERLHFMCQKEDNTVAENLFSVHLRAYQQCELCQCIKLCQYSQIKLYKNIHIKNNKFKKT